MAEGEGSNGEWTVRRVLEWTIDYLKQHGSESPRLDGEILLAHARKCPRIQLYTQYDQPLSNEQRTHMRELVKRRANAEPVAYLVGHREFFSLDFLLTKDVLIPRPDTETLVMAALDVIKQHPQSRVLDLCTGSGCIAVSLAVNAPKAKLTAVELSPPAAEVARKNIARHGVSERVELLTGDLFAPVPAGSKFDVIVSNPPYITSEEMQQLDPDVRLHEPHLALEAGADGLDVIRRIVDQSRQFLTPGGSLLIELDPAQAQPVLELMKSAGYVDESALNDLAGNARVVQSKWPGR
ncbi:MAG: peptide chain release factor N(5)-glutamine methyltransferase [Planctomycetaceae bacterium]